MWGSEIKERVSSKRGVGCNIQGLRIPRCSKLSRELFSVASLVSVFSIFMAVLIKHQYKRALCGELQAVGSCSLGLFTAIQMMKSSSGECYVSDWEWADEGRLGGRGECRSQRAGVGYLLDVCCTAGEKLSLYLWRKQFYLFIYLFLLWLASARLLACGCVSWRCGMSACVITCWLSMLVQPLMFYLFQWKMTVRAGVKAHGQHNLSSSSLRDLGHTQWLQVMIGLIWSSSINQFSLIISQVPQGC